MTRRGAEVLHGRAKRKRLPLFNFLPEKEEGERGRGGRIVIEKKRKKEKKV